MQIEKIDISSFSKSSTFYGEINALVTIKSFDLQAIRKRYIESRTNKGEKRVVLNEDNLPSVALQISK